jgi:hypothetical protein
MIEGVKSAKIKIVSEVKAETEWNKEFKYLRLIKIDP